MLIFAIQVWKQACEADQGMCAMPAITVMPYHWPAGCVCGADADALTRIRHQSQSLRK